MNLEDRLRIVSFELACQTVFENVDPEKIPELLVWVSEIENTELPEGVNLISAYSTMKPDSAEIKSIIYSVVKMLYVVAFTGAMVAAEYGNAEHLTAEELIKLLKPV